MAQVQARVATCVQSGTGPLGKTEMTGPANRCLMPDGVTPGDVVFVSRYLSDQPIDAGGTSQTQSPQNWLELGNMSIADAQVISGYVGLLWAGVWGIKQIVKSLSISEGNQDE